MKKEKAKSHKMKKNSFEQFKPSKEELEEAVKKQQMKYRPETF